LLLGSITSSIVPLDQTMAIMSSVFASRTEMYIVGIVAYVIITLAGVYGRKKRHEDWRELDGILKKSFPESRIRTRRDRLDTLFRDYDEEDY
jgi:ABC-type xylose transport system permease subunit